jgi:hypothetical protein
MKLKLRMFGGKITRVSINICTTMENKRGEAWTHEETVLLSFIFTVLFVLIY